MTWIRDHWSRVAAGSALAMVAAVTGRISYDHIYALTLALHQTPLIARLMPFGVDGLIVVGSVVLLQPPPSQRWLGWLGVGPGAAVSLFANVESGIRFGWLAAAWAGVPAASFTLATFMLERWLKSQASQGVPAVVKCGHEVASTVEDEIVNAYMHTRDCLGEVPSQRKIAERFDVSRPRVASLVGSLNGHGQP